MNKKCVVEKLIKQLEKKGFSRKFLYTQENDWKNQIELTKNDANFSKIENELDNFDLFIINDEGELCECYIVIEDEKSEKNEYSKIKNSINFRNLEVFSVLLKENEVCIKSISEKELTVSGYLSLLEEITDNQKSYYVYRGQCSFEYPLLPGIYREAKVPKKKHCYVEREIRMFKTAIQVAPEEFPDTMSDFDKLVKMQHYGLPTRLLDITQSCLIALYFAVESKNNKDGEVLIFKIQNKEKIFSDDNEVIDMSKAFFGKNNSKNKDRILVVKPRLENPRIKAQGGLFFYFGEDENKNCSKLKYFPRRIIIPAKSKKELKKELKRLLIDDSTIYLDLEYKMKQIKRSFLNL